MRSSRCRSCGAPILFAKTKDGKLLPVDAEPVVEGRVFVAETEGGPTAYFPPDGVEVPGCTRHDSHFATCKYAAKHRKPRPKEVPAESLAVDPDLQARADQASLFDLGGEG